MTKSLTVLMILALLPVCAVAQTYHWDFRPPYINDSTWWSIVGDHDGDDGHCDNTSGDMQGFPDVDCGQWNDAPQAPIQDVAQDCGTGSCTVSTTVRCVFLDPPVTNPPPAHYYTFSCTGPATGASGGVRAGNLGGGKKGVRCGSTECGCQVVCPPGGKTFGGIWVACYSIFFGDPTRVNQTSWVC